MKKTVTVKRKTRLTMGQAIGLHTPIITVVLAIMIALIVASSMFWQDISLWLYGRAQKVDPAALASGNELCEDIVEEGIVLLKNKKDQSGKTALPLTGAELESVNVFGWAAYDWMTMAFGSGYTNTTQPKTKLFPALEAAGISYNTDLYNLYKNYYTAQNKVYSDQDLLEYRGGVSFGSEEIFVLREPSKEDYLKLSDSIIACSEVGIVVIGRTGSESKDLQLYQVKQTTAGKNNQQKYTDRHYLQLSTEEEDMIEVAKQLCSKVIVVLNTANTMETGFIDDEGIDAALLVGITGLAGVNGLVNVLKGEKEEAIPERDDNGNVKYDDEGLPIYKKDEDGNTLTETVKVSPSGRTADTYAYDILGTNPTTVMQGEKGAATLYQGKTNFDDRYSSYIDYSEGIYVGYKWYETADVEGYWSDVENEYGRGYDGVVQYPFGYGMSYTDFTWTVTKVEVSGKDKTSGTLNSDDKIKIYVEVKNTGDYAGADVVELYYTPPYTAGGIEKAHVNLIDFAKTGVIQPGGTDMVELEVSVQSMASYDCYDLNSNNHTGYELDAGTYELKLMKNAHEEGNMSARAENGASAATDKAVITYTIDKTVNYDVDEKTQQPVENRFTNKDGNGNDEVIDQNDLDGSHESDGGVKYMSREDFAGTYPQKTARAMTTEANTIARQSSPTQAQLEYAGYTSDMKRQKEDNGLQWADLIDPDNIADIKFDDEIFEQLIANISDNDLYKLVNDGYFKTAALSSINKPEYVDLDGPLGFNTRVTSGNGSSEFMSYPSGTMLAQTWNVELAVAMGHSVGRERLSMDGLYGWYAPGANLHRNPFGGRNGEYYSEDGVLAGKICAGTVSGAKDMGVYSYVKHFVANDSELGRSGLFTFMTEQTLREIYLKPYEITIKEGGGNALMTAMNRLGRVWVGGNYGVMTEIVRNEWGFQGSVVTDWFNSTDDYMPPYRGIWAGNDIWLSNGLSGSAFNTIKNDTAYLIAENVAHDVFWTWVDTYNASVAYDPNAERPDALQGAAYNLTWVWYIVIVELALAAGMAVSIVFLVKNIKTHKKGVVLEISDDTPDDEPYTGEMISCPNCGEQLPATAKFCGKCGESLYKK